MQAKQERAQIAKPKNKSGDDTYNSSLSEENKTIKDIEASIDVHNKIILNARKEQEKLMVKEPGSDEVHIIDQRLYDSYEVDINILGKQKIKYGRFPNRNDF